MIADLLMSAALAAIAMGFVAFFRGRGVRGVHGCMAMANGSTAAANALRGERLGACVASAVCAYAAWRWWNAGGGDGTKRRLRSLARRFGPVRRTAPVAGAA